MCHDKKEKNVRDSTCENGGKAACKVYCFFTKFSDGYCDENNNCICNSTLTAKNKDAMTEVEIFVINK